MILEDIYKSLKDHNLVESQYEFSVEWLGKRKSYYSALKAQDRDCTVQPLLTLQHQLNHRKLLLSYVEATCRDPKLIPKINILAELEAQVISAIERRAGKPVQAA